MADSLPATAGKIAAIKRRLRSLSLCALLAALPVTAHGYYPEWVRIALSGSFFPYELAGGDFNGDGRPDLVIQPTEQSLWVMLTDAAGKPGTAVRVYEGEDLSDVVTGDFDGDGNTDIAASDFAAHTLIVLPSKGDGTFAAPAVTSTTFAPGQIAPADWDGDAHLDLAVRNPSFLTIFHGDGTGRFVAGAGKATSFSHDLQTGDIDGDGHTDVLLGRNVPPGFDLHFGKGNGTFTESILFRTPIPSRLYTLADLDADGDADIVSAEDSSVTVRLHRGSRTFAEPVAYQASDEDAPANPRGLIVAEVTGDEHVDVVVSLTEQNRLATLPGHGNGSLGETVYEFLQSTGYFQLYPGQLITGDFTRDGQTDLAVGSFAGSGVAIYANAAGAVGMLLTSPHRVISLGQTNTYTVWVASRAGNNTFRDEQAPFPTGTVTLHAGPAILGFAPVRNRVATITIPSPPPGAHSLTAHYSGDASYRPGDSNPYPLKVVEEKTTSILTSSAAGREVRYRERFTLDLTVVSPIPGDLRGSLWFYVDGARSEFSSSGPPLYWSIDDLAPGTHTFFIDYEGNENQPPSRSNVVTQVIRKAESVTELDYYSSEAEAGKPLEVQVRLTGKPHGGTPGGWVNVYQGTQLLRREFGDNRCCAGGLTVRVTLPPQTEGTHLLHATYEGNENFEPSVSEVVSVVVGPATPPARRRSVRH